MRFILAALLTAVTFGTARAAVPDCSTIDPGGVSRSARPVLAEDIIQLRDIGWSGAADAPLSVSPDRRHVAFQLRRADVAGNGYCLAMIVLDLDAARNWHRVDMGGDIIQSKTNWDGRLLAIPNGAPQTSNPRWSPDGHWIAYLRRDNGVTQVWRAKPETESAEPVTSSDVDVEDFAWTADGRAIVFATRPGLVASRSSIASEALKGFHYDDRFFPFEDRRPIASDRSKPTIQRIGIVTHESVPASADDASLLTGTTSGLGAVTGSTTVGPDGWRAEIGPADPVRPFLTNKLTVTDPSGHPRPCANPACRGSFTGIWWGRNGTLYFQKRDGWAQSRASLYRWGPSEGAPRLLRSTDDLVTGCQFANEQMICAEEGSTAPRHIVAISLADGTATTIYDPNPEFAGIALAPARRLRWKNMFGIETFGDLVLPSDRERGQRLPLVIVQYESRGFLRGGTGDEVPIQILAKAGFAVLSVQRPRDYGTLLPARTYEDKIRHDFQNWSDRKSVDSSVASGAKLLIHQGIADPARIGLSGLSDGATTVQFALVNHPIYAAVAMAQCCDEMESQGYGGPSVSAHFRAFGVPRPGDRADAYWDRESMIRAVDRIDTPILLQVSDTEYIDSLYPWMVFRARNKPIDMFVFPDEHHIKLEPQHRLAAYERYVAWFAFWLQHRALPDADPADLEHWRALASQGRDEPRP